MAEEKKTKIFISYSRRDKLFVRKLKEAVNQSGFDVWVDWEGIPLSSDWMAEITNAIESADAFLFVISPDSLKSEVCDRELELAIKGNKKIIPILYREAEKKQPIHPKIASTNWVYMRSRKEKFDKAMPQLVGSIQTDLGWVKQHTRIFQRATEWTNKKNSIYLLQGADLDEAERWMMESTMHAGREVTPVQAEYIRESRRYATRRQRNFTIGVALVLAFSVILALVAVGQWYKANEYAAEVEIKAQEAQVAAEEARSAKEEAEEKEQEARASANLAKAQSSAAQASTYSERTGELDTSTLLALESLSRVTSPEAKNVLRYNLSRMPVPLAQARHSDWIWKISVSKDGQYVVSSSMDGTACVWNMSGEQQYCVQHEKEVTNAILTDDNSLLITAGKDGMIGVWNGSDGSPVQSYRYEVEILDFALHPNNRYVVAGRGDGYVAVIDLEKGRDIFPFNFFAGPISVVKFNPAGDHVGLATKTGNLRIWKMFTSQVEHGPKHEAEIFDFEFSPDGKFIVSASEDSTAKVGRAETGRQTHDIPHPDWVEDVDVSPDSTWFATVSDDKRVRVFDSATGVELLRMQHGSFTQKLKISPNGSWIASTGYDQVARVWDAQSGSLMLEASLDGIGSAIDFSPDGKILIVGDRSGNLTFWNVAELGTRLNYISFTEYINKAKFDFKGNWILANTDDRNLWQISSDQLLTIHDGTLGTPVLTFDELTSQLKVGTDSEWIAISQNSEVGNSLAILYNLETKVKHDIPHSSDISSLALSSDSTLLATTNDGNSSVYLWDVETGEPAGEIKFEETAFAPSFNPGESMLAIGLTDKIVLWDLNTNAKFATLEQPGRITSVNFSPEGNWLATISNRGSIYIWDMSNPDSIAAPRYQFMQGGRITSAEFNQPMNLLATGSADGFAYIWDLTTGQEITRIPHGDIVAGVHFSHDGKLLATVSQKTIQIWDVEALEQITDEELTNIACARLTKNLTQSEWEFFFAAEPYTPLCSNLP